MSTPEEIRGDIERTRTELGQDVDALADKVNPGKIAERQGRKMRHAFTSIKDRVMGVASDATHSAQEALSDAGDAVVDAPRQLRSTTQGSPMAVGLIAFGVGLLAAALIPASKVEGQLAEKVKDAAEPLMGEVADVVGDSAEHLREPAAEAAEAVKERAAEAVDTVRAEGAGAMGDRGGGEAGDAGPRSAV